ncbi:MAG TPA: hypothetical protein VLG76_06620 [Rhabdochlamydiaceae bacterium]|nr:hypothetical protein [Rhabdochlamydiaceae bacterium]
MKKLLTLFGVSLFLVSSVHAEDGCENQEPVAVEQDNTCPNAESADHVADTSETEASS